MEVLLGGKLPRVLAGMGFTLHCGTVSRGMLRWWRPDYLTAPSLEAVAGWYPARADRAIRIVGMAEWVETCRAFAAPLNRNLRDAAVHIMAAPVAAPTWRRDERGREYLDTHRLYWIDAYSGEWRDGTGGQMGADLLSLGAVRWACRYGQAGARIARLAGFRVPTITGGAPRHG